MVNFYQIFTMIANLIGPVPCHVRDCIDIAKAHTKLHRRTPTAFWGTRQAPRSGVRKFKKFTCHNPPRIPPQTTAGTANPNANIKEASDDATRRPRDTMLHLQVANYFWFLSRGCAIKSSAEFTTFLKINFQPGSIILNNIILILILI